MFFDFPKRLNAPLLAYFWGHDQVQTNSSNINLERQLSIQILEMAILTLVTIRTLKIVRNSLSLQGVLPN